MIDGFINIYKEQGFTSFDVVAKLRGILKQKKIGHTGTLDPMAEGVLLVCLGSATKMCDLLTEKNKTYTCTMLLGKTSDTEDVTGVMTDVTDVYPDEKTVRAAVMSFVGDYMQIPPMYSAIKVNGKKLYELARAGQEVARPARAITIHALELLSCAPPDFTLRVHCSKGTYVRTLCHDLGAALGTGGCMAALRRSLYGGTGRAAGGHSGPPCAGVPAAAGRHAVCGPSCTDADARAGEVLPQRRFVHTPLRPRPLSPVCRKRRISRSRRGPGRAHGDREELFCDLRGCI